MSLLGQPCPLTPTTIELQVRGALRELRDSFTQLLRSSRAGVPAALLAAAARAGNAALQVDAAKALLTGTAALQSAGDETVHTPHLWRSSGMLMACLFTLMFQDAPAAKP